MDIEFQCPHCGWKLAVDESGAGQSSDCPACGKPIVVPGGPPALPAVPEVGKIIYCPRCGRKNPENNFRCADCGSGLHGPVRPPAPDPEYPPLGGLIPYRNAWSLWAYYLGVFSLIPCLGIPLGPAALVLGIKGVRYARRHPEARGKVHAWTGVILGGICGVVYTLLLVWRVFS